MPTNEKSKNTVTKRARGSGCVYLDKGNANWKLKWFANGKVHKQTAGTTNKTAAEKKLREIMHDLDRGARVTSKTGRVTLGEALNAVIEDQTIHNKKDTAQTRRVAARILKVWAATRLLTTIGSVEERAYRARRLREGAAVATVNNDIRILRRAFRLAKRDGLIAELPTFDIDLKGENVRTGFLDLEDVEALTKHMRSAVIADAVWFAILTAWRKEEIMTLTVSQVDLRAGVLRLDDTKNGEAREMPLYGALREVVERRLASVDELKRSGIITPYVFHWAATDGGKTGAKANIRAQWEAACIAGGYPGKVFHDLRRSAIRIFDAADISPDVARSLSGHKTASVYFRYNIVDRKVQKAAGEKLDALLTKRVIA